MIKNTPRKATVKVTYSKKVKSKKAGRTKERPASVMAEFNKGFTYQDPASGESDAISIILANTDMRWIKKWMPAKGDKLEAEIILENWKKAGKKKVFDCGKFCLDDLSYSGPELTCTIGGVSVPDGNAFRCTARNKTWKKSAIKEIASSIAKRYHLRLDYAAGAINTGTIEQNNETDSSFLRKVCEDFGIGIKIYRGKIVIYDKGEYETRKPVAILDRSVLQDWSYNTTLTGTYTGASIKYTSGKDNKEIMCVVGSGKRILNINEKAESLHEAELKACARVNSENEKAETMSVTIMADIRITAGSTVKIAGLGHLNGKYFVDRVIHNIKAEDAYTMDLELHKCQKRIAGVTSVRTIKSKTKTTGSKKKTASTENTDSQELSVGDRVTVDGTVYWGNNGGKATQHNNEAMYITEISGSGCKYQYGIARRKGGTRLGWCEKSSLEKT